MHKNRDVYITQTYVLGVAAQLWRMRAHPGVYFELLCASVCFLGCLLVSIELGMELAIGLAVALALYRTARPAVNIALPGSYDRGALSPSKSVAINGLACLRFALC
jgi:hypothetical protein